METVTGFKRKQHQYGSRMRKGAGWRREQDEEERKMEKRAA